ncbi:choice-of-anchor J domain-containing protein [Flavobacterium kingsejongi]|uniref:Fibronectin type-III domain-containing protein n=1 Tax=Flavobacterium kingsejongi TaxID=1678728 RepID=A0A2S1LKY2_9FLAO|nr:choice-of-anchor J domain-containing protein [Flavobacterium kingsejongi]AWG24186.1 hypothetical protein FK004_02590 [Flavobacterium kingsejongi]
MKKITLLILTFLLSCVTVYGQEGFEGASFPPTGWAKIHHGPGNLEWASIGTPADVVHSGTKAAWINRGNNNSGGSVTDWLITNAITIPTNGQLRFFARQGFALDQNTIYQIRVSTDVSPGGQLNEANYTVIQQWTELEMNTINFNIYEEKIVNFAAAYHNQPVHIAFVRLHTQVGTVQGDRWFIDDVSVVEQCLDPTNLAATGVSLTSANLSWTNPGGGTQWEVQVLPVGSPIGTTGVLTNTPSYNATGLTADTAYKFYVRSLCTSGLNSIWVGPFNFNTAAIGETCGSAIAVNQLPYSTTDDTANYADTTDANQGSGCGSTTNYMTGNDVFYSYTATTTGNISITMTPTASYSGIFVYNGCENVGVNCIAGVANSDTTVRSIPSLAVQAGETYIIAISTWATPQTTGYDLVIQEEHCIQPSALAATGATTSSINLAWTEGGTATSWEYVIQPVNAGVPQSAGTTINTPSLAAAGLTSSTGFELYVRSNCGDGTFSSWSGPLRFNTLCEAFDVPFFEGFNTDSTTEFCWTVLNLNNDNRVWDLNSTNAPFEGNQAAMFYTGFSTNNNDMLISPAINLTGNQRLRYQHKLSSQFDPMQFKVMLSTTGIDPGDFTTELVPLQTYTNGAYVEKVVNLSTIPPGPVYIAWYVPGSSPSGYQLYIDNVIVEDQPPCAAPTDLAVTNVQSDNVQLSWLAGNTETAWEIIVQAPDAAFPDDTMSGTAATNPYIKTGLFANTTYVYFVRATCGGTNGNSTWTGPFTFTTACAAFDVPFYEGFNSDSASQVCWTVLNLNGDFSDWDMDNTWGGPFEGNEVATVYTGNSSNNDWLISPALNLTGNQRLKFHYKTGSHWSGINEAGFKLMLSTTGTEPADFIYELLPETTYSNSYYIKKIVPLTGAPYSASTVHLAWVVPPGYQGNTDIYIDNVIVEDVPPCPEPIDLVVSGLTQNSAILSWTPGGTETAWEVVVQVAGTGVPTGAGVTATNPYTATGLAAGTTYEFYVRAICGGTDGDSPWSDAIQFVTVISNDECENPTVVVANPTGECITYGSGTLIGATGSSVPNACGSATAADDDVWFEFTAISTTHSISVNTIEGTDTSLIFAVYEGDDCGALTQVGECTSANNYSLSTLFLDALTVGQTYKVRVYAPYSTAPATTFHVCIKVPATPIAVSTTEYTVEQLVTDVLIGSDCAQVSNITWSTGTNFGSTNGIGSFVQNGSAFPFEGGIVLSTGDAIRSGGPNYQSLGDGGYNWTGDPELEAIILAGTGTPMVSYNATSLEFDFVPLIENMSFDFMFASEEYGNFQCNYSDSFAFILTDQNGTAVNLAVIPGTTTPVSVVTIRDGAYNNSCGSLNPEFFGAYYDDGNEDAAAIDYNGRTVVMQASATVVPNTPYHIKMVIADRGDPSYDSAVFLAAGSFNIGEVNLGVDLVIAEGNALCFGKTHILQSGLSATAYTFEWLHDGVIIPGANSATLEVTTPGEYTLQAHLIGFSCGTSDTINIEFYDEVAPNNDAQDLTVCSINSGVAEFDLSQNDANVLAGLNAADYTVTYHLDAVTAAADTDPIGPLYINISNPQTVYVRVETASGCFRIFDFNLNVTVPTTPETGFTLPASVCINTAAPVLPAPVTGFVTGGTYSAEPNTLNIDPVTGAIDAPQSTAGTYEVTYTIAADATVCNPGGATAVSITITPLAEPQLNFSYTNATTCLNGATPVFVPSAGFTTGGTFSVVPTGLIVDSATGAITLSGSSQGSYTITYTYGGDAANCVAGNSSDFEVTVNSVTASVTDFEYELNYCAVSANAFPDTAAGFTPGGVFSAMPSGLSINAVTGELNFSASTAGTYEIKYTITGNAAVCSVDQSSVFSLTLSPDVEIAIANDCVNNKLELTASPLNGSFDGSVVTYTWKTSQGAIVGTNSNVFNVTDYVVGTLGENYTLPLLFTVTITNGDCESTEGFTVESVFCRIPKGLSPNGDGDNDDFNLSGLGVKKLVIFNRYGREVYSFTGAYTNQWHGQSKNHDELPDGTYYYMIEKTNGTNETGWVYINK